jgi:hypothetical protein
MRLSPRFFATPWRFGARRFTLILLATFALVSTANPQSEPAKGRIAGQVVDDQGKPVAGAEVHLYLPLLPPTPEAQPKIPAYVTKDDGAFEFDNLEPGRYSMGVIDARCLL